MTIRHRRSGVLLRTVAFCLSAGVAWACGQQATPARALERPASVAPIKSVAEIRDLDIEYFSERAKRDPTGGGDLAHVASLLLARSRETGDPRDAVASELAARRSLKNRPERNGQARQVLSAALLAQHRFAEALQVERSVRDADPENAAIQASVAEIEMELGQYDSAAVHFAGIHYLDGDLAVLPRLSRWAEIQGDVKKSRAFQHAAIVAASRSQNIPAEQMGWFWLRAGDIELRAGNAHAADSAYRTGLKLHPGDHRLYSALARSAAAQHRYRTAIAFGEEALTTVLDPATLGTLSDAYLAVGDTAKAADYARALEVSVSTQPGAYHRAWSLFLLDHEREVPRVAQKAREELATRKDIYGYDIMAWALHREHRDIEARTAMAMALRTGSTDPLLLRHAREIGR